MKRTLLIPIALLISLFTDAQTTETLYLSGTGSDDAVTWDFKCTKGRGSDHWGSIQVPSQWELQGYGEYTYGRFYTQNEPCSDEQGLYRRSFKVPASWRGKEVDIIFDGVMTDAEVKINGKPAGPVHQGAFYRFSYRITDLLKFGSTNRIEVLVSKQSANESVNNAERRADWWLFGGIFRPVRLEAKPKANIAYAAIDARADGEMGIDLEIENAPEGASVRYTLASLIDPEKVIGTKEIAFDGSRQTMKWDKVLSWNCERPVLYVLTMSLVKDGRVLHTVSKRVGFRTVEFRPQDGIYVNGVKIVMKGVNRHCFHPESGRTTSAAIDLEDARLIRQMNANAVRSHYPPDERFLDYCDSLGIFYLDELAGWHGRYDTELGAKLVREMVRRDVNHPCVLIWNNGNEGGWNTALDPLFAEYDPQKRHVIHPWADFDGLDTHHYPAFLTGVGRFTNGYEVFMPTEFMHANYDEGAGAGLEDFWDNYTSHPLFAGGFIWAWVDESVVRTDKGGVLDSYMNMGNDGIVGPYREKEGSWYTVRDIWSPIQFDKLYITPSFRGDFLITNKYLFSNLRGFEMKYKVRKVLTPAEGGGSEVIAQGGIEVPPLPRDCKGVLHMDLPPRFFEGDVLEIEAFTRTGESVCDWTWPIHYAADYQRLHAKPVPEDGVPAARIFETEGTVDLCAAGVKVTIDKATGTPSQIRAEGRTVPLSGFRPVGMKWKFIRGYAAADGKDVKYVAKYLGGVDSVVWRLSSDGRLAMDAVVLNRDRGGKGFDDAFMDPDVKFLGFTFDYPEEGVKGMEWLGRGPYRVWKNRQRGHNIDLWHKDYNNTITGETHEPHEHLQYPEFKGYHANVYWAKFESETNPLTIYSSTDGLYLRVFTPEQPERIEKGTSNPAFPEGDLSLLFDITAIKSFKPIPHHGPKSQPGNVRIKSGDEGLHLDVVFDFSRGGRGVDPRTVRPVAGSSRVGSNPVLFLIGDSTMRNGWLGDGSNGQWGWGRFAGDFFDGSRISVENHALGGTSSRTFYRRLWPDVLEGVRAGDYVAIQFGHNDGGPYDEGRARASIAGTGRDSLEVTIKETGVHETVYSYGEYLRRYIRDVRARGATPVLVTMTPRNVWNDGKIERRADTYGAWAREVARSEDAAFVDLTAVTADFFDSIGEEATAAYYHGDHTHTSKEGAVRNAQSFAEGLKASGSTLSNYLKTE